jgi:YVTN family beta-propeller protein
MLFPMVRSRVRRARVALPAAVMLMIGAAAAVLPASSASAAGGTFAYVANFFAGNVAVVNTATNAVTATIGTSDGRR